MAAQVAEKFKTVTYATDPMEERNFFFPKESNTVTSPNDMLNNTSPFVTTKITSYVVNNSDVFQCRICSYNSMRNTHLQSAKFHISDFVNFQTPVSMRCFKLNCSLHFEQFGKRSSLVKIL